MRIIAIAIVVTYSLLFGVKDTLAKSDVQEKSAIDRPGEYDSPNKSCAAVLRTSPLGGFLELEIDRHGMSAIVEKDITGILWINASELVYTASPLYGKAGLYVYECTTNRNRQVIPARHKSAAYPDGADYFELQGARVNRTTSLFFYYGEDVDQIDFKSFRTRAHLYQAFSNGTHFEKVE